MLDQRSELQVNFEDNLEVIREEQNSPLASIMENEEAETKENEKEPFVPSVRCVCAKTAFVEKEEDPMKFHRLLQERELQLRVEYEKKLEKETGYLKDRFNFVLQ